MECNVNQAWRLLDKICVNHGSCELDKGNDGRVELDYDCSKTYSQSGKVDKLSGNFHVDPDVVLQIIKYYTEHL